MIKLTTEEKVHIVRFMINYIFSYKYELAPPRLSFSNHIIPDLMRYYQLFTNDDSLLALQGQYISIWTITLQSALTLTICKIILKYIVNIYLHKG
jgi:hypothetical protein